MIELSVFVTGINKYTIEVGYIDLKNYNFEPCYILIYYHKNNFIFHMDYLIKTIGIVQFFNNFMDKKTNQIFDSKNNEIGKIYNITNKNQNNFSNNNNCNNN